MEQQRMEQQRMEQQRMEEQRMEQQRVEQQRMEQQRMSGMEMSQTMSSSQQSSSFMQQETSQASFSDVYEVADLVAGGVMKGYKRKDEVDFAAMNLGDDPNRQTPHAKFMKDTGIFGGITGDQNCLLEDAEFDYKKHSVRDLVGHFSKVKPRAEIPVQYLPEQRLFNGDQGPSLNYLSTKSESNSSTQSMMKTTMSKQDIDASRQEYEARKKMQSSQQEQQQQQQQSNVTMRSSEEQSAETKQMLNQRRASLKDALLMDPATQHASAGIIDPSAILRGSEGEGRSRSEGILIQGAPGECENLANKWDNHNTIARGWSGPKTNYHPVTFRAIYNVDSQKPTTPL